MKIKSNKKSTELSGSVKNYISNAIKDLQIQKNEAIAITAANGVKIEMLSSEKNLGELSMLAHASFEKINFINETKSVPGYIR